MTKLEFLDKLSAELKRSNVADANDIMEEYEQHFAFKLADGYSEEEIAAKLGDPKDIAVQYSPTPAVRKGGKKVITAIGLGVTDFFFGLLCVLLYAWGMVMGALVIAFGVLSVCLIGAPDQFPICSAVSMPHHCAVILGLAFAALSVLSVVGTIYFFRFVSQLIRAFGRFHKNTLAAASGQAILPSLPAYPQFSDKARRILRTVFLFSLIVFALCFVTGFISCAVTAGSFEFWHTWGWFGYTA